MKSQTNQVDVCVKVEAPVIDGRSGCFCVCVRIALDGLLTVFLLMSSRAITPYTLRRVSIDWTTLSTDIGSRSFNDDY
jgi:hypothetical protein